jgi:hypothetical protein
VPGAEAAVNVPLLVAGVFAATFLVVCAIAYVVLTRGASATEAARSSPRAPSAPAAQSAATIETVMPRRVAVSSPVYAPTAPHTADDDAAPVDAASVVRQVFAEAAADAAAPRDAAAARSASSAEPAKAGNVTVLRLYRVLMFATGLSGLVASALMFSAVEGFSRVVVIAAIVLLLALGAIYRGFVPDPELTQKK